MEQRNNVNEFVLLGLTQSLQGQKILLAVFLLIYIVMMMGNVLIVITVVVSPTLASPMYFFLGNLSFLDAVYPTNFIPTCMAQLFMEHLFGNAEILLLVVMAYDCYVTILCALLLLLAWVGGFLQAVLRPLFVYNLPFFGPNVMDHFVCDMYPSLKLACTDTHIIVLTVLTDDGAICMVIFTLLFISYGVIIHSMKSLSQEGRLKALSTCGSHITLVLLFFVPCIFMYVRTPSTLPIDKFLTVFYTVVTPMLSPLIYTLRNGEMKNTMKKLWARKRK
ncbi:hypothetical protein FD754_002944 [Muntiacus muntjak]|uniref:G-protein coupled receptors family 1 profile domain-containing protein n=1 Tax=Muntiacus muntjak TaxID=9888 RepID=A0A5N3WD62_MUNMU|nr:hypothetical protein FD754_002944 [Muntiacus muntjak]